MDRWAVPHWIPLGNVYSVGDVLIALGVIVAVLTAMRTGVARALRIARTTRESQPSYASLKPAPRVPAGSQEAV